MMSAALLAPSWQVLAPRPTRRNNQGFPLRAALIGFGIGCGLLGTLAVRVVEDGSREAAAAKGCLGGGAFGTLIALQATQ
jgi:hypothetical protein